MIKIVNLTFEEEKKLLELKEEMFIKLINLRFEKQKECIRLETANRRHLEDYKSQLIQQTKRR